MMMQNRHTCLTTSSKPGRRQNVKDYTVKSETAVFSDTMKITETTDSNHASNINAGPRDITKIQNAKAQLAFDESDGGLNIIIKEG